MRDFDPSEHYRLCEDVPTEAEMDESQERTTSETCTKTYKAGEGPMAEMFERYGRTLDAIRNTRDTEAVRRSNANMSFLAGKIKEGLS
jgi:hypothetical protein